MAEEKNKQQEQETSSPVELAKSADAKLEASKPEGKEIFPTEEFEHLPPEAKKQFSKMISMFMASGPAPHPLISKMNTEQVGTVIENIENESIRDHDDRMSSKKWGFAALVVVLVFILLLSAGCLWKDKSEYIAPIITALIAGVGGYGVGISRNGRRR